MSNQVQEEERANETTACKTRRYFRAQRIEADVSPTPKFSVAPLVRVQSPPSKYFKSLTQEALDSESPWLSYVTLGIITMIYLPMRMHRSNSSSQGPP